MDSEKTEVGQSLFVISNQDVFRITACPGMNHTAPAAGFYVDNIFRVCEYYLAVKADGYFAFHRVGKGRRSIGNSHTFFHDGSQAVRLNGF